MAQGAIEYVFRQPVPVDKSYEILKSAAEHTQSRLFLGPGEIRIYDPKRGEDIWWREGKFSCQQTMHALEFTLMQKPGTPNFSGVVFHQFSGRGFVDTNSQLEVYARDLIAAMARADVPRA